MVKSYSIKDFFFIGFLVSLILLPPISLHACWAALDDFQSNGSQFISTNQGMPFDPWYKKIKPQWGGHFKIRGSVSWPDDESLLQLVGTDPYYDGNTEFRFNSKLFLGDWGYFESAYESVLAGGDTRRKGIALSRLSTDSSGAGSLSDLSNLHRFRLTGGQPPEDDRRLMDLTSTIDEDQSHILYHRLDRLCLTMLPAWGAVCVGRQAITWGNGLLFNPMDLFNPFSPTDIDRDYKIGDDMVSAQFLINQSGGFQLLYVPRRDPVSGNVEWDQTSLAGKLHFPINTTEFDLMFSKHYQDIVSGIGAQGYLGNAAWRIDGTGTFLNDNQGRNKGYLSLAANMDYSWTLWGKNFYGFLEFYLNGLSHDRYAKTLADPDFSERLDRGELFTLGRTYLSGHIRVELHPLFNIFLTVINNMADPSGIIQPRAIWDITENVQLTFGGNTHYGGRITEFGGFKISDSNLLIKAPGSAFLWLSYFF